MMLSPHSTSLTRKTFHDGGSYGNERAIRKARRFQPTQEQAWVGVRCIDMTRRFVLLVVAVGFALVEAVSADENLVLRPETIVYGVFSPV
jgi:hypothetical protein